MRRVVVPAALAALAISGALIASASSSTPQALAPTASDIRLPINVAENVYVGDNLVWPTTTVPGSTTTQPATTAAPTTAPATTAPPTTAPTTTSPPTTTSTTTVPTTTTSTTTTTTVPTTTTTSPPTTTTAPPGTPGQFTETFQNLNNWIFAFGRVSTSNDGQTPATANIVNGALRIVNGQQNYGDATARSLTKYDLSKGGTVTLDIADDGAGNTLVGSAYVMFSAGPQDARLQHADDRPEPYGPVPTEGTVVWLRDNCRVPWGPPVVVTYPAIVVQRGSCTATPNGKLRLVYTSGRLSIRNGAGAEIVAYNVTLPPVGFLTIGVHNHASIKYASQAAVTGTFDNVTYPTSGAAPAPTTTTAPPTTTTAPTTTTVPSGSGFTETFVSPSALTRFEFQLRTSSNGGTNTKTTSSITGEHDSACHGPDTYRTVTGGIGSPTYIDVSGSDFIWYCAPSGDPSSGHMMTALDTTDIAWLSFSPRQDFNGVTEICWKQNMNDMGEAKWANVFVVPVTDVQSHGGNLNYEAALALPFGGNDQVVPAGGFDFTFIRGTVFVNGREIAWKSYVPAGIASSPGPRFQICLRDYGQQLVVQRPDSTTDTYATAASFPASAVKVIFQDASYNPTKHNGFTNHLTWHWDDITVNVG